MNDETTAEALTRAGRWITVAVIVAGLAILAAAAWLAWAYWSRVLDPSNLEKILSVATGGVAA